MTAPRKSTPPTPTQSPRKRFITQSLVFACVHGACVSVRVRGYILVCSHERDRARARVCVCVCVCVCVWRETTHSNCPKRFNKEKNPLTLRLTRVFVTEPISLISILKPSINGGVQEHGSGLYLYVCCSNTADCHLCGCEIFRCVPT